jgi:hypothetical protein
MNLETLKRFLSGLLAGAACGVAIFAIAAVSGYSLAQVHMTRVVVATEPTPTVDEIQRALEQRMGEPYALVTPTPASIPWDGTPVPLEQIDEAEATPTPTPTPTQTQTPTPAAP